MRRIGIVAMARQLLLALWRLWETGEFPEGAALKEAEARSIRLSTRLRITPWPRADRAWQSPQYVDTLMWLGAIFGHFDGGHERLCDSIVLAGKGQRENATNRGGLGRDR